MVRAVRGRTIRTERRMKGAGRMKGGRRTRDGMKIIGLRAGGRAGARMTAAGRARKIRCVRTAVRARAARAAVVRRAAVVAAVAAAGGNSHVEMMKNDQEAAMDSFGTF